MSRFPTHSLELVSIYSSTCTHITSMHSFGKAAKNHQHILQVTRTIVSNKYDATATLALTKANRALSIVLVALVVIFLIAVVGFGLYLQSTLSPNAISTYTFNSSVTGIPSPLYRPSTFCSFTNTTQHYESTNASSTSTLTCFASSP